MISYYALSKLVLNGKCSEITIKTSKYLRLNTIENPLFVGKVHLHFPELDSTNRYALDLISKSNPSEGTVISTDNQAQGRGQIGSIWESTPEKNLTLSIILYPHFLLPRQQFYLNQAISLGVYDFFARFIPDGLKIKWSNDLYVKDRKIAGILIQNSISSHKIKASVVGLGLNVNQRIFGDNLPNPTSLSLETQKDYLLKDLLLTLFSCIEKRYLQLKKGSKDLLDKDYLQKLYRYQEKASYQRPDGSIFYGEIIGLDPNGKLKIVHEQGQEVFGIKEIKFLH